MVYLSWVEGLLRARLLAPRAVVVTLPRIGEPKWNKIVNICKGLNNSIIPSATLLKRVRFNSYSDFVRADWRVGIINKWTDRDNVFSLTWPHRFCLVDILSDHGEKTDCCGMQDLHRVWKSSVEEAELKRALLLGCLWQASQVFGGKLSPTKKVKMTDA